MSSDRGTPLSSSELAAAERAKKVAREARRTKKAAKVAAEESKAEAKAVSRAAAEALRAKKKADAAALKAREAKAAAVEAAKTAARLKARKSGVADLKAREAKAAAIEAAKAAARLKARETPAVTSSTKTQKITKDSIEAATARARAVAAATAAAEAEKVSLIPPAERAVEALLAAYKKSRELGKLDDIRSLPVIHSRFHGENNLIKQIAFNIVLTGDVAVDIVDKCLDAQEEIKDMLLAQATARSGDRLHFWTTMEWFKIGAARGEGKSPELEWHIPEVRLRVHRYFSGHPRVVERKYKSEVWKLLEKEMAGTPVILLQAQIGGLIKKRPERSRRKSRK